VLIGAGEPRAPRRALRDRDRYPSTARRCPGRGTAGWHGGTPMIARPRPTAAWARYF